jgi:hypothetical protein
MTQCCHIVLCREGETKNWFFIFRGISFWHTISTATKDARVVRMTCECYFKRNGSSYVSLWNHVTLQLTFAQERCCSACTCCGIVCYLIPELLFAQELRSH